MTRQKIFLVVSLMLVISLFGCNKMISPTTNQSGQSNLETYIDPEIQGEEREIMLQVLAALPEDSRDNVTHITEDGKIYTNRVANKEGIKTLQKVEGTANLWKDADGNIEVYPAEEPYPEQKIELGPLAAVTPRCELDGTGLSFRMQTKPGGSSPTVPRMKYASVSVFLPSRAANQIRVDDPSGYGCPNDPTPRLGETPYVYLGGWGGRYDPSSPSLQKTRVDAGLQWNCGGGTDNYSLFFRREDGVTKFSSYDSRFNAGQTVNLEFIVGYLSYPINPNPMPLEPRFYIRVTLLILKATGVVTSSGTTQTVVLTIQDSGWNYDGYDNILSLNSSLAQKAFLDPKIPINSYERSNSVFSGVVLSNLKAGDIAGPPWNSSNPPSFSIVGNFSKSWNGLSTSDPLTGGAPCKLPGTTTSGIDPIEVYTSSPYSSNPASTTGIRVDITAK